MNKYLKEQFLVHLSNSAKEVTKKKGHSLKKSMPQNVSSKNALKIARFRNQHKKKSMVRELKKTVKQQQKEKNDLKLELTELKQQVDQYQFHYGLKKPKTLHKTVRGQLQEIISLEREIVDHRIEAKKLFDKDKISEKELNILVEQFEKNLKLLNKKKKNILTS